MLNDREVVNPMSPNNEVYTAANHKIGVIPSETIYGEAATVKYALNPDCDGQYTGSYSEIIPQIKDAGKYEIWYLIEQEYYDDFTGYFIVTIVKADLTISVKSVDSI